MNFIRMNNCEMFLCEMQYAALSLTMFALTKCCGEYQCAFVATIGTQFTQKRERDINVEISHPIHNNESHFHHAYYTAFIRKFSALSLLITDEVVSKILSDWFYIRSKSLTLEGICQIQIYLIHSAVSYFSTKIFAGIDFERHY